MKEKKKIKYLSVHWTGKLAHSVHSPCLLELQLLILQLSFR